MYGKCNCEKRRARARAERKFAATQARKTATATSGCIMGPRHCQSHLPAARDSTTSTISGRRRAPWRQHLLLLPRRPPAAVSYPATRRAQTVVRNRAVIIRKAELTGETLDLASVSRRRRLQGENQRERERERERMYYIDALCYYYLSRL